MSINWKNQTLASEKMSQGKVWKECLYGAYLIFLILFYITHNCVCLKIIRTYQNIKHKFSCPKNPRSEYEPMATMYLIIFAHHGLHSSCETQSVSHPFSKYIHIHRLREHNSTFTLATTTDKMTRIAKVHMSDSMIIIWLNISSHVCTNFTWSTWDISLAVNTLSSVKNIIVGHKIMTICKSILLAKI